MRKPNHMKLRLSVRPVGHHVPMRQGKFSAEMRELAAAS